MGPRNRLGNLGESERTVDGHKPMIPPGLALPEEGAMELWLLVMVQLVRIFVLESWFGEAEVRGDFDGAGWRQSMARWHLVMLHYVICLRRLLS